MSDVESNEEDVMQEGTGLGDEEGFGNAIDQVGGAADAAFEQALNDGASPEEAFQAATDAAEEAASEAGFPPEEVQARTEAAKEAFDQALEEGKDPEECFDEASDAAGFNEGDQPPPFDGEHQEGEQPPPFDGEHQEGEQQGGGSDGGLGALETAMGPEPDTAGANAGEPDSLDDAVGQAMDANTDQGGPPAGDPGTHIEPDVGGEPDDFAPDEADESTSEPDLGD